MADAFKRAEAAKALPANASPIERSFWNAHLRLQLPVLTGLVPQYPIGRRRMDFALPLVKIGIELDGQRNHSSTTDVANDCRRQREIEAEGWRLIRFGGAEVHRNAEACVRKAAEQVEKLRKIN